MKKTYLMAAAALMTLAACNKSETVVNETPGEMTFKVFSNPATKADASITGISLKNSWGIYAAATQKNAQGVIENQNFFSSTEQLFETDGSEPDGVGTSAAVADTRIWQASPAVYWPLGGVQLDFLAYAMPKADHNAMASTEAAAADWTAYWNNYQTDVAEKLSFNGVDTYANQIDLLYAAANGQTSAANSVSPSANTKSVVLNFKHAQALLIFNAKSSVADKIKIDEIAFYTDARVSAMRVYQTAHATWAARKVADGYDSKDADGKAAWDAANAEPTLADLIAENVTLKTIGTFTVDNTKIDLEAGWSDLATDEDNYKISSTVTAVSEANKTTNPSGVNGFSANLADADTWYQMGETLLIPQQPKVKFTMTYTIGDNTYYYTHNDLKGVWEMGKKYIYNIDIQLHEIYITESVADFVDAGLSDITLN